MMNRIIASTIFFLLIFASAFGQSSIKTHKLYEFKTAEVLSDEYQYLSTELYLFNASQFTGLVNALDPRKKKGPFLWRKINQDKIEYLMITANIKDIKYYGGDIIYPIYSFQATPLDKDGYEVHVDDNQEVIRIFDNLPLNPGRNAIDADIKGEIITTSTKDKILNIIADQLINISEVPSPTVASLGIIKEFGRFMKMSTGKNLYKFNSTIRLYEGQDFSKQFYSLDVYCFTPSMQSEFNFSTDSIDLFLKNKSNPEIDRKILAGLIEFSEYPYFIVVNYKSRYKSEEIIMDDITVESIAKHRIKIKQKFEDGTIPSQSAYIQEIKMLDFLEEFVEFKTQINTYRLNEKNQITQDISKILYLVAEAYTKMQRSYANREIEFKNDQTYQNSFREKYLNILAKADLMLELNQPLKNIRDIYSCINPQKRYIAEPSAVELENQLRVLHQFVIPEYAAQKELAMTISKKIGENERVIYQQSYEKAIQQLKSNQQIPEGIVTRDLLINQIKNSNCKTCLTEVRQTIEEFNQRYELSRRVEIEKTIRNTRKEAKDLIYFCLYKEKCVSETIDLLYPDPLTKPKHVDRLVNFTNELIVKRSILEQLIEMRFEDTDYVQMEGINNDMTVLIKDLKDGYSGLCIKMSELCKCNEVK